LGTVMSMVCSMPRRCEHALSSGLPGGITAGHSSNIDLPEDLTGRTVYSPTGHCEPPPAL
jgi:hypothetical protein